MKHSKFSASAAHRWTSCPASVPLGSAAPRRESSPAAREGTGLHAALDVCLVTGQDACELETVLFEDHGEPCTITMNDEQAEAVQFCLDTVRRQPGSLFSDIQVEYSQVLGLRQGEAFGTLDVAVLDGSHLHVWDAKFGRKHVEEQGNLQMLLYALGMVSSVELLGDSVDTITLHIMQPRTSPDGVDGWTLTRHELEERKGDLRQAAVRVEDAERDLASQKTMHDALIDLHFNPCEEACRWCPAASVCPALARKHQRIKSLADLTTNALTDEIITEVLESQSLVGEYIEAVKAEAIRRVTEGRNPSGYKLVLGRAGNRRWGDEDNAVRVLALAGIEPEAMREPGKLLSPAKMDRVAKAAQVDKAVIEALTVRNPPKPTLVLATEPGEPWQPDGADLSEFGLVP